MLDYIKKYEQDEFSKVLQYNVTPIKVYNYFVLTMWFTSIEDIKWAFYLFCKLVTLYLNRREKLRNRTNQGMVVFWCYIGI